MVLVGREGQSHSNRRCWLLNWKWSAQKKTHFVMVCRDQQSFQIDVWYGVFNDGVVEIFF